MDTPDTPLDLASDEIKVIIYLRPLPRSGYPHELERVRTVAYWTRLMQDTPKYKDPMFTVLGVACESTALPPPTVPRKTDEGRVRLHPKKMKGPRP